MTAVDLRPSSRRPPTAAHRGADRLRHAVPGRSRGPYLRRRVGVAGALTALAVVGLGVSSTRFADADPTSPRVESPAGPSFVIVQPGDTLWSLARDVQPEGDIRPLVAQLSRAHGGSSLRAGERIALAVR